MNHSLLPFIRRVKLYWSAFLEGVDIIIINQDGKRREVAVPKGAYTFLDYLTSSSLREYLKELPQIHHIHGNRHRQSLNDLQSIERYKRVGCGDIKNAHYSSNIFILLVWNFLFCPALILKHFCPLIALYCSPRKSKYRLENTKILGLRFGLSTTEALFRLTQLNIFRVLHFINNKCLKRDYLFQIYVDDYVFYSNNRNHIMALGFAYKTLNRLLFIKVHAENSSKSFTVNSTKTEQSKVLERLGLIVFRNQKGELKASIRDKTIRKYLDRIESDIKKHPKCARAYVASSIFAKRIGLNRSYVCYGYPLYQSFPPGILWTDIQQQKRTLSRVIRIFKKHVPDFYCLSFKQIRRAIINN
jgi:hypothetical protein